MPHFDDLEWDDVSPPDKAWAPAWWTPMKSTRSLGDDICDFAERFVKLPRNEGGGEFKVLPWQRWLLQHMFELNDDGRLRYHEIYWQIARKNSKSFILSAILLYFMFKAEPGQEFYCAAYSRKQSTILFEQVQLNLLDSPFLRKVLIPGAKEIRNKFARGAKLEPLSGESRGAHGGAPYISVGDELHTWDSKTGGSTRGRDLYTALTSGSGDRTEYLHVNITTPGIDENGIAHEQYEYGKGVVSGAIQDEEFGFYCWEASEEDDISSPETWMKANPMIQAGVMSVDNFAQAFRKASETDTSDFEIFRLGKWLKHRNKADFISAFHWNACRLTDANGNFITAKIPKGATIVVGFDGSLNEDSTGIVAIDVETGLCEILYGWEKNPKIEDWFVDVEDVEDSMDKVFSEYNVVKLYADPSKHHSTVDKWRRTYGRGIVRDMPPSSRRMISISEEFRSALYSHTQLFHVNEKRLTSHVLNAIETVRGLPGKEHPKSPNKIDFLACLILAHGALTEYVARGSRDTGGITSF